MENLVKFGECDNDESKVVIFQFFKVFHLEMCSNGECPNSNLEGAPIYFVMSAPFFLSLTRAPFLFFSYKGSFYLRITSSPFSFHHGICSVI